MSQNPLISGEKSKHARLKPLQATWLGAAAPCTPSCSPAVLSHGLPQTKNPQSWGEKQVLLASHCCGFMPCQIQGAVAGGDEFPPLPALPAAGCWALAAAAPGGRLEQEVRARAQL